MLSIHGSMWMCVQITSQWMYLNRSNCLMCSIQKKIDHLHVFDFLTICKRWLRMIESAKSSSVCRKIEKPKEFHWVSFCLNCAGIKSTHNNWMAPKNVRLQNLTEWFAYHCLPTAQPPLVYINLLDARPLAAPNFSGNKSIHSLIQFTSKLLTIFRNYCNITILLHALTAHTRNN